MKEKKSIKLFSFANMLLITLPLTFNPFIFTDNNKTINNTKDITYTVSPEKDDSISVLNSSGQHLSISKDDITLIAKVVSGESRGEPYEGQVAVASVILNRLKSGIYSDNVSDIIFQKNAFSCVADGQINADPKEDHYKAVYDALAGEDPTSNALYFYNPQIATSSWMINTKKDNSIQIGNHVFFSINK